MTVKNYEIQPNAHLRGAGLNRAKLNGADLTGSNLSGANLNRTNLSYSDFFGAHLMELTCPKLNCKPPI